MATVKYFSGTEQVESAFGLSNEKFAAMFPGVQGKRYDSFSKLAAFPLGARRTISGEGSVPVTRVIEFKSNPSLHKCDSRCRSAKGRSCECSCGGQYHGAGC